MGLDQRQGELGDLADELFEAVVFLSPLFDLGKQIHWDVSGMGFGFDFPGQIVAQVFLASGTAAVGIAASAADGDKAGGQDWAFGLELFLAGLEEAADQRGVFGYFHALTRAVFRPLQLNSIKAYQLPEQNVALRQLFENGIAARPGDKSNRAKAPMCGEIWRARKARRLLVETHAGAPLRQAEFLGLRE